MTGVHSLLLLVLSLPTALTGGVQRASMRGQTVLALTRSASAITAFACASDSSVLRRVGVPARAMRFPRVEGAEALTTPKVLDLANGLGVPGIYACAIPTEMIELLPDGNGANQRLVRDSVSVEASLPVTITQNVAGFVRLPRQNPAHRAIGERAKSSEEKVWPAHSGNSTTTEGAGQ